MPYVPPHPDTQRGERPQTFHLWDFKGLNRQKTRPTIGDQQFYWLENYNPIDTQHMRTVWSNAAPLVTASANIIYTYFYNIGTLTFAAVFLSDGTAFQVSTITGVVRTISSIAGFFYNGGALPAAAQWNAQGIVIVCESQNPNGYFAWDGNTLFAPGQAAPGWLTNQTATTMPSGVHGAAVETYGQRVWITAPAVPGFATLLFNSAPNNGANFNTATGGGVIPQGESSIRHDWTALKQSNGFLYVIGDSSVSWVANVQPGPPVSYQIFVADPQVGSPWRDTVQSYGIGIIFANIHGVFLLSGSTTQKISHELDEIFATLDQTFTPTASVATIFGLKTYLLLIKAKDYLGVTRVFLCAFNGAKWFIATQDRALTLTAPQEVNSLLSAWGSDGLNLFQLFQVPSLTLKKTLVSKLWSGDQDGAGYLDFKKVFRLSFLIQDYAGSGVTFNGSIDSDFTASSGLTSGVLIPLNAFGQVMQSVNVGGNAINATVFGNFTVGTLSAITNQVTGPFFEFTNATGGIIHFINSIGFAVLIPLNSANVAMQMQNSSLVNIEPQGLGGAIIVWGVVGLSVSGTDIAAYGRLIGMTLTTTAQDFAMMCATIQYSRDAPYLG